MPASTKTDMTSLLLGGADGVISKTPSTYNAEFPLDRITVDPTENYRWGSKEAMEADLKATSRDPSDGSMVCSYRMLVESIRTLGVEDAVGIVPRPDGTYRVVYGFTRVMAAKEIGLGVIPAKVYDASLPYEESQLLQLRENSLTLKRQVNWVAEVQMYQRLVAFARKELAKPGASKVYDAEGDVLTPKKAACATVSKALGVAPATMKNRFFVLKHIDPRIVKLSEEGKINYAAASEFSSGDANVPFGTAFVTSVLEELARNDPKYERVTAETVRQVMRRLRKTGEKEMYEGGQRPSTACGQWSAGARQTSGALRDLSVSLWTAYLTKYKASLATTKPEEWEKAKSTRTWFTVIGIGIGAADVTPPVTETGEDTGRAELQHDETSWRYAVMTLIHAALMKDLRKTPEQFREWVNNFTAAKDGGVKRANRMEFHNAIMEALDGVTFASPLYPVIRKARDELRARLGV